MGWIKFKWVGVVILSQWIGVSAFAAIAGTYKAVLQHEGTAFHQYALITLRTVNPGEGELKISANVKVFFGDWNSNEFLSYEFPVVERNLITGQLTMREPGNDVSLIGILKNDTGVMKGEWYSTLVGKVGAFEASKDQVPEAPTNSSLVTTVTGDFRGEIENTHPEVALPENVTATFVTRQDTSIPGGGIIITGSTRLYYGEFGSLEYEHLEFSDIQFNFYNRFLTARTKTLGIVYKGTLALDGTFSGYVYADGYGQVGSFKMKIIENGLPNGLELDRQ